MTWANAGVGRGLTSLTEINGGFFVCSTARTREHCEQKDYKFQAVTEIKPFEISKDMPKWDVRIVFHSSNTTKKQEVIVVPAGGLDEAWALGELSAKAALAANGWQNYKIVSVNLVEPLGTLFMVFLTLVIVAVGFLLALYTGLI